MAAETQRKTIFVVGLGMVGIGGSVCFVTCIAP